MSETALSKIEAALRDCPALKTGEMQDIFEEIIGRTARSAKDSDLEKAFADALKSWQR